MEIFAGSYLLPMTAPPQPGGAVAVDGGRIVAVGPLAELKRTYNAPVTEYPGAVIMPGLVNAHSHLELTHFSSWKLRKGIDYSPRTYVDWVIQVIKIRRGLSREELEQSVREGIRIALESGTTGIGEILSDRSLLPLYMASPLAGRLFFELLGQNPLLYEPVLQGVQETLDHFPATPLFPGVSPHAPHTVDPRLMEKIVSMARQRNLPISIHLAESREESAFMHDTTGKIAEVLFPFADWQQYLPPPRRTTSVGFLDQLGVLGPDTSVVHAVHVTPADVEILRERRVSAILCPRSNDRLDVGRAPVALLKKREVPLCLGTDSLASNDSLSLWDEMRFARREFPGVLSPGELLEMATFGGARALHREDEIGSLSAGKRGDFLVMRLPAAFSPRELPEMLIEEGQVEDVFVAGERVV